MSLNGCIHQVNHINQLLIREFKMFKTIKHPTDKLSVIWYIGLWYFTEVVIRVILVKNTKTWKNLWLVNYVFNIAMLIAVFIIWSILHVLPAESLVTWENHFYIADYSGLVLWEFKLFRTIKHPTACEKLSVMWFRSIRWFNVSPLIHHHPCHSCKERKNI